MISKVILQQLKPIKVIKIEGEELTIAVIQKYKQMLP
jgi:hypothetical protein